MKRTPFYALHQSYGAKLIEFAGYEMPVHYEGILSEHQAVRESVGVFDVSHMGEIEIRGDQAFTFLQKITTNDLSLLYDGKAQYSTMLYENDETFKDGGIIDDIIVYQFSRSRYMLIVNASNIEKNLAWLVREQNIFQGVEVINRSDELSLLALQGRHAEVLLQSLTDIQLNQLSYYHFVQVTLAGVDMMLSRTGYTGEDGFELCFPNHFAESVWSSIFEAGKPYNLKPIGLGARDTLRLEMGYALYGHEIDDHTTPIEAGLGWITKISKGAFNGKAACERERLSPTRKLIGFELFGKSIARQGYDLVNKAGEFIGTVCSGTLSPTLQKPIGTGYVSLNAWSNGDPIFVKIRGELLEAKVVKPPFINIARN